MVEEANLTEFGLMAHLQFSRGLKKAYKIAEKKNMNNMRIGGKAKKHRNQLKPDELERPKEIVVTCPVSWDTRKFAVNFLYRAIRKLNPTLARDVAQTQAL